MQIVKCFCNLSEKLPANGFLHLPIGTLLLNILVERNALNIICDYANLFGCFYQIMHFYNMWVVYFLQGHYFTLDGFSLHGVVQFCFLVDLNGIFAHVHLVVANVYDGVCSLTYWFADLIVFQDSSLDGLALESSALGFALVMVVLMAHVLFVDIAFHAHRDHS